jgi:hypothetical protein
MAHSPRVSWRLRRLDRCSRCRDVGAGYAQPASTSNL